MLAVYHSHHIPTVLVVGVVGALIGRALAWIIS